MKILFTADIHIKLGQKNVPVEWARSRYTMLFDELARLQSKCDLLVLGGDIFDKLPSMEELEVYFELISIINKRCIIYPGNHEALKKNTTFLSNLKSVTNRLNKNVTIIDDYHSIEEVDFIPYNRLKEYRPNDVDFRGRVLCTHVRGDIPPHVKAEVPLELFERWEVVLAGDLHSHENSQKNIVYPGSPITTSFHRNRVNTGVVLLSTDTCSWDFIELDLPQLIRKTVNVGDPMPATTFDHTVYDVQGDIAELSKLESNELIDKKIASKSTDSALILDSNMSISEEIGEYLRYILDIPDSTVTKALQRLNHYVS